MNNPTKTVTFPLSFNSACYAVVVENSYTGDAKFFGTSVVTLNTNSFQYTSGSYGSNAVRFFALGI